MSKEEQLKALHQSFANNKWLFPSTWGDKFQLTDNITFRSYFNDSRDFSSFEKKAKKRPKTLFLFLRTEVQRRRKHVSIK